ncbi:MAG: hypothetical protein ACKO6N_03135 [Myxococcota bacterium]
MRQKMLFAVLMSVLCSTLFVPRAHAFFEEDTKIGNRKVSTVHYHLTRALARCVGFDATQAETLAGWNQVVDSMSLELPTLGRIEQNFSVRMGPNDPFFHWARPIDLTVMKRWVQGKGELFECLNTPCTRRRPINTGLESLSMEAFGVYLHSVGDHHSHSDCIHAGYREHTDAAPQCPLDSHHHEFGPEAANRTYVGIKAMLEELIWWAGQQNVFSRVNPALMEDTLINFVTEASFEDAAIRVQLATDLYDRCAAADERGDITLPTNQVSPR